jgi:hypothetical protein
MRMNQLYELVDVPKTAQQMGPKLIARIQRDRTIANDVEPEAVIQQIRDEVDPTDNHQYTLWILRAYLKGGIRFHEDMSRTHNALKFFHANKRAMTIKDINQIKMLSQLEQMVSETQPVGPSGKDVKREQFEKVKDETKVFYSGPEGKIIIPETEESSCFWGQGTQWCTAASTSHNYFAQYSNQGPLYIILPKDGTKWQLHVESSQFLDAQDNTFDIDEWSDNYPWAHKLLVDIYPAMNPLWKLKDKVSDDEWRAEVLNRATAANIPRIDGIDGKNIRLDYWSTLQELLDEAGVEKFSTEEEEFSDIDSDIKTTPTFDELLLSRLGSKTRAAVERRFNVSSDEAVVTGIMEGYNDIKPIYDAITAHYSKNVESPSDNELATAASTIIASYIDEYDAFFRVHDDDTIGLYMNLDTFASHLDAENEEHPDESFSYHSGDSWLSIDRADTDFDGIVADGGGYSGYYEDEVAVLNRAHGSEIPDVVTVSALRDTDTKDMFGNNDANTAVEISVEVIDEVVKKLRRSLQIFEARSFKTILGALRS